MKLSRRDVLSCMAALPLAGLCGCDHRHPEFEKTEAPGEEKFHPTHLSYFGYRADSKNLASIEGMLEDFSEKHPDIHVVYECAKGRAYYPALLKRARSDALDDIFMIDRDRGLILTKERKLANIQQAVEPEHYLDFVRTQFELEPGHIGFIPTSVTFYGLFVNEAILKKEGIPVPNNLERFEEACEALRQKGYRPIVGNNFGTVQSIIFSHALFPYLQENKGHEAEVFQAFNEAPETFVNILKPGIELIRKMLDNGWLDGSELYQTEQTSDDLRLFLKGDAPFMITGGWASARLPSMGLKFPFCVYPLPVLADGGVLPLKADTNLGISLNTSHPIEARKFLRFVIQPKNLWKYCNSQNSFMPIKNGSYPKDPVIQPAVDCMRNGRYLFFSDYRLTNLMDSAFFEAASAFAVGAQTAEASGLLLKLFKEEAENA